MKLINYWSLIIILFFLSCSEKIITQDIENNLSDAPLKHAISKSEEEKSIFSLTMDLSKAEWYISTQMHSLISPEAYRIKTTGNELMIFVEERGSACQILWQAEKMAAFEPEQSIWAKCNKVE